MIASIDVISEFLRENLQIYTQDNKWDKSVQELQKPNIKSHSKLQNIKSINKI